MAEPTLHGDERTLSVYTRRTLEKTFPELVAYLRAGLRVLDVGCGPATITMGVAESVRPGRVEGIDPEEIAILSARKLAAKRRIENIAFHVADTYQIPFDDNTFDVTYSHALFDWLSDPVSALKEQARATKPGSSICAMMCTQGSSVIYPEFPALQKVFDSWALLADTRGSVYHDRFVGRRSVEIFKSAGLTELTLKPMQQQLWYAGQTDARAPLIPVMSDFLTEDSPLQPWHDKLTALGVLDERTVERARQEYAEWKQHPHSLFAWFHILAAGRVPPV
jgi:ubiquinone/menaquinone biosynthesis C-methylase UbiE